MAATHSLFQPEFRFVLPICTMKPKIPVDADIELSISKWAQLADQG
jgi:hypothetical protein